MSSTPDPWAPYAPDGQCPWDLRRVVAPAPPGRLRGHLGRAAARPQGRAAGEHRPRARRQVAADRRPDRVRADGEAARRRRRQFQRPGPAQGVVGLPDAVRPGPAGRAADADVARPLRHQQPQGQRPRARCSGRTRRSAGYARAPFGELLRASVRDPALLVWLDAPANRKGHPNENLARELMELFTLGIGHYTEADVKEAARALTGWTVEDGEFLNVRRPRRRREDDPRSQRGLDRRRPGRDAARPLRRPPTGWPGGCADCSSARTRSSPLQSRHWPTTFARTSSTSAGRSRRSCGRKAFFAAANLGNRVHVAGRVRRRCRTGAGNGRPDRRARWRWPTGRPGSGRTCFTRPTSAAGPAAGRGSRRGRRSAGRTSPHRSSPGQASAGRNSPSMRSRWPKKHGRTAGRRDRVLR